MVDKTAAKRQKAFKANHGGVQISMMIAPDAKDSLDRLCAQLGLSQRQVIEHLLKSAK